jgi:hypothetical protein
MRINSLISGFPFGLFALGVSPWEKTRSSHPSRYPLVGDSAFFLPVAFIDKNKNNF